MSRLHAPTEIGTLARKLARALKYAGNKHYGDGVTPEEREALDLVIKFAERCETRELVAQCDGDRDPETLAPLCHGTDVRRATHVESNVGWNLCIKHRKHAETFGARLLVGELLPPKRTSWPCRNPGCPRTVSRQGECCTPACASERLAEFRACDER
jgi:hypothetical protein